MPVFEDESSKGGSGGEGWLKQPGGRSESKIVDRSSRNQAFQLGQGHQRHGHGHEHRSSGDIPRDVPHIRRRLQLPHLDDFRKERTERHRDDQES